MVGDYSSSHALLSCGVPQGSILGPLLFSLYLLPLGKIIASHNLHFHCYADDIQIYLPITPDSPDPLSPLSKCLEDINQWLAQNFLLLNQSKTEYILVGHSASPGRALSFHDPLTPFFKPTIRNLGVMFDYFFFKF